MKHRKSKSKTSLYFGYSTFGGIIIDLPSLSNIGKKSKQAFESKPKK
jgi:hypothetical protein